jgi:hypothetical protein
MQNALDLRWELSRLKADIAAAKAANAPYEAMEAVLSLFQADIEALPVRSRIELTMPNED